MKISNFSKLLTDYLSVYLPSRVELSSNTISSYCDTFRLLLRYCRDSAHLNIEKLVMTDITNDLLYGFLDYLEKERNCSNSTLNQRLNAIHSFIRFVQVECPEHLFLCNKILDMRTKRTSKPSVSYLTVDSVREILAKPDTTNTYGRRDLTLICLMYDIAARVQEIANLSARDVRLESPAHIRLIGKGRKQRDVPISDSTSAMLKSYMREHQLLTADKLDHWLFTNRQNQKLTRAGIAYILDKYCSGMLTVNETGISPHILRHSKAMHLLQAGVSVVYIKYILGHVDISTTEVYARADMEMKRIAIEKVSNVTLSTPPIWSTDKNLLNWLKDFGKQNP